MNGGANEPTGSTDRLLAIAVLIAVAAAAAAYFLHARLEGVRGEIDSAKRDYLTIMKTAKDIATLLEIQKERGDKKTAKIDVVTYLGSTFTRSFAQDQFTVTQQPERKTSTWKEQSYKVQFRKKSDSTIDAVPLIDTLIAVEKERPDLKSKEIQLEYKEDAIVAATVIFSSFERN